MPLGDQVIVDSGEALGAFGDANPCRAAGSRDG